MDRNFGWLGREALPSVRLKVKLVGNKAIPVTPEYRISSMPWTDGNESGKGIATIGLDLLKEKRGAQLRTTLRIRTRPGVKKPFGGSENVPGRKE